MGPLSEILTGKTESHLIEFQNGFKVHAGALASLKSLQAEARANGFELDTCSAFRGFAAQLRIWNAKAKGERALLDTNGEPLDVKKLRPQETVEAILRWSALPGASRHHWGTDLDVFDRRALTPGYQIQLVPEEFVGQGPFRRLHDWLDQNLARFGFFRPYDSDRGGVSPERWHISYAPIAQDYLQSLTVDLVHACLSTEEMELKSVVLLRLDEIFTRYIRNVSSVAIS